MKVGVVLSGGQAAGGHNVIAGLFDGLKKIHPDCQLIGFTDGPVGIVKNQYKEITAEYLAPYRNQGGFDIIGSGRTKIETPEQFEKAYQTVKSHDLDGLVIIGGDDSNTNAAFLGEYFLKQGQKTSVIGVPKTIDGDLKTDAIEIPFGFDTACKTYSECIGNIARDAISAKKYYFFIKLMGRSASHIALECALQTHANLTFIGEEVAAKGYTLQDIVDQIVSLVKERKNAGKEYGLILIPEGIIEFLSDMDVNALPPQIQQQLLADRDPHGNVQVSRIETERLLIYLVEKALGGSFLAQPCFFGYEGRAALPSNFDATYCYALGMLASIAIGRKKTGYIVSFQHLTKPVSEWVPAISPLLSLLHEEIREEKRKL